MQTILNEKTCRCYNKDNATKVINVYEYYLSFTTAAINGLGLKEDDRIAFISNHSGVSMAYDMNNGFKLYRKSGKNYFNYVIRNKALCDHLRRIGKRFVIDSFREGKYILKPVK